MATNNVLNAPFPLTTAKGGTGIDISTTPLTLTGGTLTVTAGNIFVRAGIAIGGQGAYLGWNRAGGPSSGATTFSNHPGLGTGGWEWADYNSSGVFQKTSLFLTQAGNLSIYGSSGNVLDLPNSDTAVKTTTTLWTVSSDSRIKTNIADVEEALPIINALKPRRYNYTKEHVAANTDANGNCGYCADTSYYGFVADEVETVLPSCVKVSDTCSGDIQNIKTLNMHNANILLFKAVQELSAQVSALQEKIAALQPT